MRLLAIASRKARVKTAKGSLYGSLFLNQSRHPFLSDPCPLLAGPHTGTGCRETRPIAAVSPCAPFASSEGGRPPSNPRLSSDACCFCSRYVEDLRCSRTSSTSCRRASRQRKPPRSLLPAQAAAAVSPVSPCPPRSPAPRRRRSRRRRCRNRTRPIDCAHTGEASACRSLPFLLLGSHHVAPSTSCIFAPSLRVARVAENLPLRGSSSPPGFRFLPCAPSVRVRRARRKAPDGARTYREGERSWKNFTQRLRR